MASDIRFPSLFDGLEVGERLLDYSLANQSTETFLSKSANGADARWTPVTDALVSSLAAKSAERVAKAPAFADIKKEIEEATKEIFEELKGKNDKVSVKEFMKWESVSSLIESGDLSKQEVQAVLDAAGVKSDMAFDTFKSVVQTLEDALEEMDDAAVELVWEPAWNQGMISIEGKMKLGMI